MGEQAINLLYEECRCIPKVHKVTLPPLITLLLSWEEFRFNQEFALKKIVIPHGLSPGAQRVKKRIHFEFDAHRRANETWDCFLILYDVVSYAGRDDWRCVTVEGERLLAKRIRWRQWENESKIIGFDKILPTIGILLQRYFKKVGPDGFNEYLFRMTPKGETPQKILLAT